MNAQFGGGLLVPRKIWELSVLFSLHFAPGLRSKFWFPLLLVNPFLTKEFYKLTLSLQRMRRQVTRPKKLKQKRRNQPNLWLSVNRSGWCCNSTMWPTLLKMLCQPQLKSMIQKTPLCSKCIIHGSKIFLSRFKWKNTTSFSLTIAKEFFLIFYWSFQILGNCAPTPP